MAGETADQRLNTTKTKSVSLIESFNILAMTRKTVILDEVISQPFQQVQ